MKPRIKACATGLQVSAAAGILLCAAAAAAAPIAPVAPWAPGADKIVAQWSKLFHKQLTRESALKEVCRFPSEEEVGVKAYPGSLLVDWQKGGGSAGDGDDVPHVELATKAPLDQVIAWYRSHYPNLKPKYMFETAGPGVMYSSTNQALITKASGPNAVAGTDGNFSGCSGLIAAPRNAGYQTGIDIYYQPNGH